MAMEQLIVALATAVGGLGGIAAIGVMMATAERRRARAAERDAKALTLRLVAAEEERELWRSTALRNDIEARELATEVGFWHQRAMQWQDVAEQRTLSALAANVKHIFVN